MTIYLNRFGYAAQVVTDMASVRVTETTPTGQTYVTRFPNTPLAIKWLTQNGYTP